MNKSSLRTAAACISSLLLFYTVPAQQPDAAVDAPSAATLATPAAAKTAAAGAVPSASITAASKTAGATAAAAVPDAVLATPATASVPNAVLAAGDAPLKVVLIRHAEKPLKGDNLTCQGINRSLQVSAVLHDRFGIPEAIYVPSLHFDENTKHSRMFQTIVPFAAKYNLPITGKFHEDDTLELAQNIREKTGTVFVIWEHSRLPAIARCLGVRDNTLDWPDDDYDSLWIITYRDGAAILQRSSEGLHPAAACAY